MKNIYYHRSGKYQADYDRLVDLMPMSGQSDTVAGELIRAVSKLGHELYNNGMGNNSSGAVNFLLSQNAISQDTYDTIHPLTTGRLYNGNYEGDSFQMAVESAIDQTLELIRSNPELETRDNSVDMHDLADDEEHYCEECGDEVADGMWGGLCSDCEYNQEEEELAYG